MVQRLKHLPNNICTATKSILFLLSISVCSWSMVYAAEADDEDPYTPDYYQYLAIKNILALPEDQIDLAIAKLTIDKMIDNNVDIPTYLKTFDKMAADVRTMFSPDAPSMEKMVALKAYLFQPGEWNHYKIYQYDLDDSLGTTILSNALVPNLLDDRKGNCVSMSFLFIILGQKMGIDVTLSTAPKHVFVRFKETETGKTYNIETTNGGNIARDAFLIQESEISEQAIANEIYLQSLTRKEAISIMLETPAMNFVNTNRPDKAIAVIDLALEFYPKNVSAMIVKGDAYYKMTALTLKVKGYKSASEITEEDKKYFESLNKNNLLWFSKAEALGWREFTAEHEATYQENIRKDKEIRGQKNQN